MNYKWLFFDADNTLMDFDQSAKLALKKTFDDYSIPYKKEFIQTYYAVNKTCWEAFEKKEFTALQIREERFDIFLKKINLQRDGRKMGLDYLAHLGSLHFMLAGAYDLLDQLKNTHQLVLVTNGLQEVQHPRLKDAGLHSYFPTVVISDEIGVSKPDPEFFDIAFDKIGNPNKKEVLMIGDSLSSDILGGNQYGIDTCWYNPNRIVNNKNIHPTFEINALTTLLDLV